jgi:hypothetical protein
VRILIKEAEHDMGRSPEDKLDIWEEGRARGKIETKLHQVNLRQMELNEHDDVRQRYQDAVRAAKRAGETSPIGTGRGPALSRYVPWGKFFQLCRILRVLRAKYTSKCLSLEKINVLKLIELTYLNLSILLSSC